MGQLLRSACPSVCLSDVKNHTSKFHLHLLYLLSMAVARFFSGSNAICYVLPVLWTTPCFYIMEWIGQNQRRFVCFVQFARWRYRGEVYRLRLCRAVKNAVFNVVRQTVYMSVFNLSTNTSFCFLHCLKSFATLTSTITFDSSCEDASRRCVDIAARIDCCGARHRLEITTKVNFSLNDGPVMVYFYLFLFKNFTVELKWIYWCRKQTL